MSGGAEIAAQLWYFGYGSNMHPAIFLERRRMRPRAVRRARLEGYRLRFNLPIGPGERGVANVEPEPGARIWGILYLLTHEDSERLDRTEGVPMGAYRRIAVEVLAEGGERVAAFTYRSTATREGRRPSARYLRLLVEGARLHALPADYVRDLESAPLAHDEREKETTMPAKKVRFYFAYNSPYSFLASTRLATELAGLDAEVEYKPVYSPRSGGGPDLNAPKFKYILEDVRRFADAYGLALAPGPFADSRKACLGFFHARAQGRERAYHDAVYAARWLAGKDIGDPATLAEIAERAGLERTGFLAALDGPESAAALDASNREAQADEVFGFPFFVYAGQKFWGNDRLDWLIRALRA